MEETNFVLLWKEQYEKIDQSLAINKRLIREVIARKGESALRSLVRFKTGGIVAVVIYLALLGIALYYAISNYSSAANYFIVSMGAIFLINVKALYDYIRHLDLANSISYNGSITETQRKLNELQLSILRHSRFMVLQFPFWTTFHLSDKWFPGSVGWGYIVFQLLFTASFTYLAYWLYKHHTMENVDNRWARIFIKGSGGKSVIQAIEFAREIESFERGN